MMIHKFGWRTRRQGFQTLSQRVYTKSAGNDCVCVTMSYRGAALETSQLDHQVHEQNVTTER